MRRSEEKLKDMIFEHMEMYWSNVTRDAVDVEYIGRYEVVVTVSDGTRYLYNDLDEGIRRLPDKDNMSKEECLKEFGYRLYNIMRYKHIGQETLSEMTRIPQARLSEYITGRREPGFYNLDKIVRAVGCSVDELRYF